MEIILALLALEAGLLREQLFVALVLMALATSLISGPTMKWMLRSEDQENLAALLRRGAWIGKLDAWSSKDVIEQLTAALHKQLGDREARACRAVLDREAVASTGLGDEVAVPHAAVAGLDRPLLALGFVPDGIDFNAPDGAPSKIVFLLLMPPRAQDLEVRILAQIARAVIEPKARERLLRATSLPEVCALLSEHRPRAQSISRSASLADI
jgi:mannitol/fructose-specific phosphotransferase system IIA component (Ntr-type)